MLNVLAGTLTLCAYIPYVASILSGTTKPSRVSWWIWAVVGGMLLTTYLSVGGEAGIGIATSAFIGQVFVALLSLRYGTGGATLLDRLCLLGAAVGALLWWGTGSAYLPYILMVAMDCCAFAPTFWKSLRDPHSENFSAWFLWTAAAALTILNVQSWTVENTLYPVYIAVSDAFVLLAILRRYA